MSDYIDLEDPVIDKQLEYYRKEAVKRKVFDSAPELVKYLLKVTNTRALGTDYSMKNLSNYVKLIKFRYMDGSKTIIDSYLVTSSLNITKLDYGEPEVLAWCILNAPIAAKGLSNKEIYEMMIDSYNSRFISK